MKRSICAILAICVIFCLGGCRRDENGATLVVPDEERIEAALRQAGLPGEISEEETFVTAGGGVSYSIRDPNENDRLVVAINGADIEGKRFLKFFFFKPPVDERPSFAWEDWQKQFELAALLTGRSADAGGLYLAFSKMTPSIAVQEGGSEHSPAESFELVAQLSPQYGIVQYSLNNATVVHGFPTATVLAYSQRLVISIYESEADYSNIQDEIIKAREARENKN